MMAKSFYELFNIKKPIIGTIHLAGQGEQSIIDRALEETRIYAREGLSGAIVEDSHIDDIEIMDRALKEITSNKSLQAIVSKLPEGFNIGVNCLKNPLLSFNLANQHSCSFVQLDVVAGEYGLACSFDGKEYKKTRKRFPNIAVLGGVRSKCSQPVKGSGLIRDLEDAVCRVDAIVVKGEETEVEVPPEKISMFRSYIDEIEGVDFPLIIGSGLNSRNAYEQLILADGAIAGSSLRSKNDTYNPLVLRKVRELMKVVRTLRNLDDVL